MWHNLKFETRYSPRWYLGACSTKDTFVFFSPDSAKEFVRTVADGWTIEDAESFHNHFCAGTIYQITAVR